MPIDIRVQCGLEMKSPHREETEKPLLVREAGGTTLRPLWRKNPKVVRLVRKDAISRIIAVLCGVLLSFDNFPGFYKVSGLYTGAPVLPFLLIAILFLRGPDSPGYRLFRWWTYGLLIFGVLSAVVTLFSPSVQTAMGLVSVSGETILTKGIKTFIIASTWILSVRLGYILFQRNPHLLIYAGAGLLAANALGLTGQSLGLLSTGGVDMFHAVRWHEDRIRGFKFESSVFGASIIAAAALVSLKLSSSRVWLLMMPVVFAMVYLTTSRGALVALVLGVILSCLFYVAQKLSRPFGYWAAFVVFTVVVLMGSLFGYVFVTSSLWAPLSAAGSDATRSGWGLVALQSVGATPIGLNVINYWLEVRPLIESVTSTLQPVFGNFNLLEFSYFVHSESDSGLSPKTLPALLSVWFGLPGLIWGTISLGIAAANASLRRVSRGSSPDVFIISTMLSLVLFVPGIFIYETALVLGAALSMRSASVNSAKWRRRGITEK